MNKNQIVTIEDLEKVKNDLIAYISSMHQEKNYTKKILRSSDVKKLLNISTGSLQNLRISRKLKFSKVNGTIFYDYDDVINLLKESTVEKKSIF